MGSGAARLLLLPARGPHYPKRYPSPMFRLSRRAALLTSLLLLGSSAQAAPKSDEMITKLLSGNDFRVRVQAALELGKGKNDFDVIEALIRALDDNNASVRAAAAAALKNLRARSALKAL